MADNLTRATAQQGFLSGRWQRRDGTVYGTVLADQPLNSPVAGGPDADAKVDVPSGAPRADG